MKLKAFAISLVLVLAIFGAATIAFSYTYCSRGHAGTLCERTAGKGDETGGIMEVYCSRGHNALLCEKT